MRIRWAILAILLLVAGVPAHTAPLRTGTITRWSDGDTVRVAMASGSVRVRLIGIDAPETSPGDRAGRQGTQLGKDTAIIVALGKQAKAAAERLAPFGTAVRVETEVALYDRYARLLAYLWLPDGRMVNEELVRGGWALLLTIPPNVRYADRFVRAQQDARAHRRGLWASP